MSALTVTVIETTPIVVTITTPGPQGPAGTGGGGGGSGVGFVESGPYNFTDGQSATNLSGETINGSTYTSGNYYYEVIRGTTIVSTGQFSLFYVNGTWVYVSGPSRDNGTDHGLTFSISQSTTIAQLKLAASSSGGGNGTIKFKKMLFSA